MFGVSFLELAIVAMIALLVVGPQKLPGLMRTLGEWLAKARKLTREVRAQTGIDDILREEGIDGVNELRALLRGEMGARQPRPGMHYPDPADDDEPDPALEFPVEGADCQNALPEDLSETVESIAETVVEEEKVVDVEKRATPSQIPAPPAPHRGGLPQARTMPETPKSRRDSDAALKIEDPPERDTAAASSQEEK
ncbi:MAG: twin-arginine translocase TatA/TatE family subunit [Polyangiaceae bacterium]|nr:twin-arginine translocase TatA/TatE family subunit [Polyangiaceae bacterium]